MTPRPAAERMLSVHSHSDGSRACGRADTVGGGRGPAPQRLAAGRMDAGNESAHGPKHHREGITACPSAERRSLLFSHSPALIG